MPSVSHPHRAPLQHALLRQRIRRAERRHRERRRGGVAEPQPRWAVERRQRGKQRAERREREGRGLARRDLTAGYGSRGDLSWDALFEAGGRLVADGWTAEMAIPFKSLRCPSRSANQMHRWAFRISRNIREKSESLVRSPVSTDVAGH